MTIPVGAATYQARRFTTGAVVNFKVAASVESTFDIVASIQPIGSELRGLSPGLQSKVQFKLYTTATLYNVVQGSTRQNDQVFYNGVWFEVVEAEPHNEFAPIPHKKYYMFAPEV